MVQVGKTPGVTARKSRVRVPQAHYSKTGEKEIVHYGYKEEIIWSLIKREIVLSVCR